MVGDFPTGLEAVDGGLAARRQRTKPALISIKDMIAAILLVPGKLIQSQSRQISPAASLVGGLGVVYEFASPRRARSL